MSEPISVQKSSNRTDIGSLLRSIQVSLVYTDFYIDTQRKTFSRCKKPESFMAVFLSQTLRLKYLRLLCIFYHSKAGKYILYFAFFITLFITLVRGVAETSFLQGFQARLINVRLPYRVPT